ncbi:hypothetical protein BWZ20_10985 [Winogradskyella sp. J14-2]|uniref:hybrid sensor histidine kinase/response regulator transcription factor n=1 Tax=Winogradskyella sp. J14-2 TaxID=1936080 RepID=UPI0009726BDB|nr:response regulator [Winogradskyella sp. J14-2]APY08792.1 hypothetical protein BWZ20_10985 [Winogradskyella sp. J14-2]
MIKYLQIICIPLIFFSLFRGAAQNTIYELQSISLKDGLPNNNTFDIVQDQNNFIWISTIGSLVRYDGYGFKNYNLSFFNINENAKLSIALDQKNRIWYCEDIAYAATLKSGILDTETDSIYSLESVSNGLIKSNSIFSLNPSKNKHNVIFLTTRDGVIYKYDGTFKQIFKLPEFKNRPVHCEVDAQGFYWIAYYNTKIIKIDDKGNILKTFSLNKRDFFFKKILTTRPHLVAIGYNSKLEKEYWEVKDDTLTRLDKGFKNNFQLIEFNDTETVFFQNDTLFKSGFEKLNTKTPITSYGNVSNIKFNDYFIDRQNILWLTSDRGIFKIIAKKNAFNLFQPNNSIRGIYKEKDSLFISGYNKFAIYNLKTNVESSAVMPDKIATGFISDQEGNLWLGTTGKFLYRYNLKTKNWHRYEKLPYKSLNIPYINPITKKFWIGTGNGLSYLDDDKNILDYTNFKKLEGSQIKQFLYTADGIWIVSNKGLFLMDATLEKITQHISTANGLPTNNLNHLHIDDDGVFWLATKSQGLIKWHRNNETLETFTTQNGLSNNTIYAIYEDDYNNLWLPSNYGLMRFDKISKDTQVFTESDGIANDEFNAYAHFKDSIGTLYFGGVNGVTSFHPRDFVEKKIEDNPLYLLKASLLKKNAKEFQPLSVKAKPTDPIKLNYDNQILKFEVSLLDYKYISNHQYAYKIEGFHNQWIYTKDNEISIFNFPYGNHTIRVKAKGNSDLWSNNELLIPIIVDKPFYLKWQYISLFFIILLLCIYFYFKWRIIKLNKATIKLEAEVASRTQQIEKDKQIIELQAKELKALDIAKGRFFANLTHEFRTPLTLIVGPLEQIIDNPPPAAILKRRATGILNNAKHILGLINQLLDLTKLESKQMPIEAVNADIVSHTNELVGRFQGLAAQNAQQLSFQSKKPRWNINFDIDKWDKITYNLISNALKFTPKNGVIKVVLSPSNIQGKTAVELHVIDSGVGIEEKNKDSIFNRFYQADLSSTRANDGTGIGLALVRELVELQGGSISVTSKINKGSTFRVLLPVLADVYLKPYIQNHQNEFLIPSMKYHELPISIKTETDEKLDVLVVEDNEDIRDYIAQCLGQKTYNIATAKDGKEGLEKALSSIPDLIISDVMMPKINGFQLVEAVRNEISTSHIPIILLTAKTNTDSKLQGLKRGADDYLTKPFNPKELNIRVKNLIEIRQSLQNRYNQNEISLDDTFEKEDAFILQLKAYILENLQETDLNGDIIGKHFALSRIHLYRKLKALTNVSISEFVKDIRLEKGLELLSQKQLNISEIAYEIGFTSPSQFSRSFKDKYGKPPSKM